MKSIAEIFKHRIETKFSPWKNEYVITTSRTPEVRHILQDLNTDTLASIRKLEPQQSDIEILMERI